MIFMAYDFKKINKIRKTKLKPLRVLISSHIIHLWYLSGKNTGVSCHFLLQGIFPTLGLNPGFPHCRQTLLPSEPPGKSGESLRQLNLNV